MVTGVAIFIAACWWLFEDISIMDAHLSAGTFQYPAGLNIVIKLVMTY
jgi:hypothetical protein